MKVFCKIISVFLSIIVVALTVCTVVLASAREFLKPEKLKEEIQNIEIADNLKNDSIIGKIVEDNNISIGAVENIIQSEPIQELVDIYTDDLAALIAGEEVSEGITYEKLKDTVEQNKEQIVTIIRENTEEEMTDEEINGMIDEFMEENGETIVESIPSVKEIEGVVDKAPAGIKIMTRAFNSGAIQAVLIVAICLLAVIIFLLNIKGFSGFLWIGIDALVSMAIVAAAFASTNYATLVISNITGFSVKTAFEKVAVSLPILAGIGIVFVIAFILIKFLGRKKEKAEVTEN